MKGVVFMYDYNYMTNTTASSIQGPIVWFIIAAVLAVIGGIVIYLLFVRTDKKEDNKYLAWFKDFANFKKMLIEPILKVTYLILAIFITLYSFGLIGVSFVAFLLTLILGNILLRLAYETTLILLMIWKNTTEINKKMK